MTHTLKYAVGHVDDVALSIWKRPVARRLASLVLLTAMADFVAAKSDSAVVTYAQHMLHMVQPVLDPVIRAF